jgi:hypothetical protein
MSNQNHSAGRVPLEISSQLLQQDSLAAVVHPRAVSLEQNIGQPYCCNHGLLDDVVPTPRLSAAFAVMVTVFRCSALFAESNRIPPELN